MDRVQWTARHHSWFVMSWLSLEAVTVHESLKKQREWMKELAVLNCLCALAPAQVVTAQIVRGSSQAQRWEFVPAAGAKGCLARRRFVAGKAVLYMSPENGGTVVESRTAEMRLLMADSMMESMGLTAERCSRASVVGSYIVDTAAVSAHNSYLVNVYHTTP